MTTENTDIASAINLSQIAQHPNEALAALVEVVQRQEALLKEHEMRLDKQGEYIRELQFKENPEPQPRQKDRGEILIALLAANKGKMFAKDARHKLGMSETAFSLLLRFHSDKIASKPYFDDRRKHVIELK